MTEPSSSPVPKKNYECDDYTFEFKNDYIFVFANEASEKTTIELDTALEENYMTEYVKKINGKTISIKYDKKQKAAAISDEVGRRSSIARGMTYVVHHRKVMNERKTIEENSIGTETTIEMSQDTPESEED